MIPDGDIEGRLGPYISDDLNPLFLCTHETSHSVITYTHLRQARQILDALIWWIIPIWAPERCLYIQPGHRVQMRHPLPDLGRAAS